MFILFNAHLPFSNISIVLQHNLKFNLSFTIQPSCAFGTKILRQIDVNLEIGLLVLFLGNR